MSDHATDAEIDALNLLVQDGYPLEKGATLVAAMRRNGQEPVTAARHFIKLRHVLAAPAPVSRVGDDTEETT